MSTPSRADYQIVMTMSVPEAIRSYFKYARQAIESYQNYLERHRELDFLRMRRFLNTTYKTLTELDPEYMSLRLGNINKRINTVADIYDDFVSKSKVGVHSYDIIFLRRQENYGAFEDRMTTNAEEIGFLRSQAERFKESVAEQKDRLAKSSKLTGEYKKQEEELKRIKRLENTTIVRLGNLLEENVILSEVLKEFRDTYEDEFVKTFNTFVKNVKPELLSILNALAFEFDIELWHKAKESDIIRNHFKNAYAGEVVNSKMYLSYFLKNLDPEKMGPETKELQKLLDYLNDTTSINVVVYMAHPIHLETFQAALESDDNGIVVHTFVDAKQALKSAFQEHVHILIIDMDIKEDTLKSFVTTYKNTMHRLKMTAKIIMVTEDVNDGTISKAESLGADSLIEREEDAVEIIDTVYELLKVDTSEYMQNGISE